MSSICQMLAETLVAHSSDWDDPLDLEEATEISDALLASPLADIIDLAAAAVFKADLPAETAHRWLMDAQAHADLYALLADWRATRAERPTP